MGGGVRILCVEDQAIMRAALKLLLESEPELAMEIALEAGNAREAYAAFDRGDFDLVLLDLSLPGTGGLAILEEARRRRLAQPCLVLSGHAEPDVIAEAMAAGARGYISKAAEPQQLFEALRRVAGGERYLPPSVSPHAVERRARHAGEPSLRALLSPREREVFDLLLQGFDNQEIGEQLFLSHKTVETHRYRIFTKLNVHTLAELTRLASRHGLLPSHLAG